MRTTRLDDTITVGELVTLREELLRRRRNAPLHSDLRLELRGAIRGLGLAVDHAVKGKELKGPKARRARA